MKGTVMMRGGGPTVTGDYLVVQFEGAVSVDLSSIFSDSWNVLNTVTINGSIGNDTIIGSIVGDLIRGGGGFHQMTGDVSADGFIFDAASDSAAGALRDRITDFEQ